jgi:malonate decarboxylase beta subunit
LIWAINGGEQRVGMGLADALVEDDAQKIAASVRRYVEAGLPRIHRSDQIELYRQRIAALDVSKQFEPLMMRESWGKAREEGGVR